jgi:uncharacterized protein (TIGR03118 family)
MRLTYLRVAVAVVAILASTQDVAVAGSYQQVDLVSDVPGLAANTDPNLKNPWGISFAPGGVLWVSNQGTNTSTLYNGSGTPSALIVTTPTSATGPNGPTGQVFNNTSNFLLSDGANATFIFAQENGGISGWNPAAGTSALLAATGTGANYQGLALGVSNQGNVLYAADNAGGKIDVYDGSFHATTLAGTFTDPTLPTGFKPYNIQNLGGTLYVTYSSLAGGGVVATFDQNGNFLKQLDSNAAGGVLNSPWGVVMAPASFGQFGGDLLVGNRGDGTINAFSPTDGAFLGTLDAANGAPLVNSGLWGLTFGSNGNGLDQNTLYITAGINGYRDGLLASISAVPEPSSIILLGVGLALTTFTALRRRSAPTL